MVRGGHEAHSAGIGRRAVGALLVVLLVGLAGLAGLAAPLDRMLGDQRFGLLERPASGETVFVAIDAAALESVGVWPWPRSVHAQLITTLMDLGAYDVWVDIDFSSASSSDEDAALQMALQEAGGYAYLAAFLRQESEGTGLAMPIDRFAALSDSFAVNVMTDAAGVVRKVPSAISDGERVLGSLATLLSNGAPSTSGVAIDYGISASTIASISAADVLSGGLDQGLIEGKHVVIGASALELQDFFYTPNQGVLPGAVIQILAAETVLAGRALSTSPAVWTVLALVGIVLVHIVLPMRGLGVRVLALIVAALAIEAVAGLLYIQSAIIVPTALFHLGAATLGVVTLMQDTRLLDRLVRHIGGERDALRAMLERVVADNYDGVVVIDAAGAIVTASQFAERFLGTSLLGSAVEGVLPADIVAAVARIDASGPDLSGARGQTVVSGALGRREIEYVVTRSTFGAAQTQVICVTFRDITERLKTEKRLAYLAAHDPVTDTLSRNGFLKQLEDGAGAPLGGVFVVEIERFKAISASLGHQAGDELLRQISKRLARIGLTPIAHLGQAQFAIGLPLGTGPERSFAAMRDAVAPAFDVFGHSASVGLSAGFAPLRSGDRGTQMLRQAEAALLTAMGLTGNRLAVYDDEEDSRLIRSRRTETQLVKALEQDQFFLVYQPQHDLRTGAVTGAEALIRWQHEGKVVPPFRFLPIAEQTGLIVEMSRWILREACTTAAGWPLEVRVAVNISALHFELGDLVADVEAALGASGLDPSRLEIEITETVTVAYRERMASVLGRLRARGVKVAIDDFGTGYSSLAYLDQLPFDVLKIDKSFVDGLTDPDREYGVVSAIVGIGKTMGKTVLAEGIENPVQLQILRAMGCDLGQGYHFARPLDAGVFASSLRGAA